MIEKNELPEGWSEKQLSDLLDRMSNGASVVQHVEKIGLPISRIETIWNETIDLNRVKYIYENDSTFIEKYKLEVGDILFSHINSDIHLGKTAIYKLSNFVLIHGINLLLLRPKKDISSKFLNYQFKFKRYNGEFMAVAQKAVNQSSINQKKLSAFKFIFPSIDIQHRIVEKVETLFSELDNSVANLKAAKAQLKRYRQSVLKSAFEGKLTAAWREANCDKLETAEALMERIKAEREAAYASKSRKPKEISPLTADEIADLPELPKGWFWGKVNNLTLGVEYGTSAKSAKEGKVPVLRMGNIQNTIFDYSDLVYTNDDEEIEKYRLKKGDVLFNRTNSPELVGKTAIFLSEVEMIFAGYLIRCNQIESISIGKYLNYFLNSKIAKDHGNNVKTDGVNQSNINGEKLKNYPFPFTTIEEQLQIVNEIESRLSEADVMDRTINESLIKAEKMRQSILKKAFEGKLC
jgi:type I restriction enzyme S subunit